MCSCPWGERKVEAGAILKKVSVNQPSQPSCLCREGASRFGGGMGIESCAGHTHPGWDGFNEVLSIPWSGLRVSPGSGLRASFP